MFTERHLPAQILLALAKNDSTPADVRREIIELMIERDFKEVNDIELRFLVAEIKQQKNLKQEIHEMIEAAVDDHLEETEQKSESSLSEQPFQAGFTTKNIG